MAITHKVLADLSTDGSLTDITADIDFDAGLAWTWGRSDWLSPEPNAGTFTFTLDNSTGAYTPGNPTGVYQAGCREGAFVIWYTNDPAATVGSVAYVGRYLVFKMLQPVINFPTMHAGSSQVVIACTDVLARMQNRVLASIFDEEVLHYSGLPPAAYWPLTESDAATSALSVAELAPQPALVPSTSAAAGNIGWSQAGGVPTDSQGGLLLTGGPAAFTPGGAYWNKTWLSTNTQITVMPGETPTDWTIGAWITAPLCSTLTGGGRAAVLEVTMSDGWSASLVWDRTTGLLQGIVNQATTRIVQTYVLPDDGASHYVTLMVRPFGVSSTVMVSVGVDGNQSGYAYLLSVQNVSFRPVDVTIGAAPRTTTPADTMDWTGAVHHVALWGYDMSSWLEEFYLAGTQPGWLEVSTDRAARLNYYFNRFPYMTGLVSYTPRPDLMEMQDTNGVTLLTAISDVLRLEGSQFMAVPWLAAPPTTVPTGEATLFIAQSVWNAKLPRLTIDAQTQLAGPPDIGSDVSGRVLSATASGRSAAANYIDASLLGVTTATGSVTVATSDAAALTALAQNRVAQGKAVSLRVQTAAIDLNTSIAPSGGWCNYTFTVRPGDRLRVTNLPLAAIGWGSIDHYVAGGSETYTTNASLVSYVLQPADAPPIALFKPAAGSGIPDTLWRFTATGLPLTGGGYSTYALTASATTIQVVRDVSKPALSATAGDYPLFIAVGTECVQLTAPATTTTVDTQTFTGVVRGANNTNARSHFNNDPVDIWQAPCFGP